MGKPAGQYAVKYGSTSAFSAFTVGDVIKVTGTTSNNGVYTVNAITNDGLNSYLGLSGLAITEETGASVDSVTIEIIGLGGNKIVCLGDEDDGSVAIWSYNDASNSNEVTNTTLEFPQVGTSGWSKRAVNPTIVGNNAEFVFTSGQSAIRVCDSNIANTSIIKHFGHINRQQFSNNTYGDQFIGYYESANILASPSAGGILNGDYQAAVTNHSSGHTWNSSVVVNNGSRESYGIIQATGTGGIHVPVDLHLRRSLNQPKSDLSGDYETSSNKQALIDPNSDDLAASSTDNYIYFRNEEELAKIPLDAVIGFGNTTGSTQISVTHLPEKVLVKGIDVLNKRVLVDRGYGRSAPAAIDASTYEFLYQYGCGFNFTINEGSADSGQYEPGIYEFAQSFVYDGNQESLLRTPITMQNGQHANNYKFRYTVTGDDFKELQLQVFAFGPYHARVSGGRIYTRLYNSNDSWSLLVDIDIEKGCRTSMDSNYVGWISDQGNDSIPTDGTACCFYSGSSSDPLISKGLQLDKYADINNYYPDISRNSIGYIGESYQTATTGGERAWVGNVKIIQPNGTVERFGDRIMYSEFGKYDVFPDLNYFTASRGDAEDITIIEYFGDRLLIFKNTTLHIWNVASNEPFNWIPERTVKFAGVNHSSSVASTPYGIVWANPNGCYFYDGRQVVDLTEGKIRDIQNAYHNYAPSWNSFITSATYDQRPLVIYHPKEKQIYVVRDSSSSGNSSQCYIYNFLTRSWTFSDNLFSSTMVYSNPISDWNHNPLITESAFKARYVDTNGDGTADGRIQLALLLSDSNLITETVNQDISSATGNDWIEWSPATVLATFNIDNAGGTGTADKIHIVGTSGASSEGAYLAVGNLTTPVVGHTYEVSCKLKAAGAMTDNPFYIEYAGDSRQIGDITTTETLYTVHLKAANTTGGLYIYYIGTSTVAWTIDSITVSMTSIKLNHNGSGIGIGDVLQINEAEIVRVIKAADPFYHVERGYAGTSLADASADAAVYIQQIDFKQIDTASSTSVSTDNPKPRFITKDFDFDKPGIVKKVYKIYVTYKNTGTASLNNALEVSADGNTSFVRSQVSSGQSVSSTTSFTDITQSSQINTATDDITMDGANTNIVVGLIVTDEAGAIPPNTKVKTVASAVANPQVFILDKYLTDNIPASTTLTFHEPVKPTLSGRFNNSVSTWDVATFTFNKPLQCQSLSLHFNDTNAVNSIHINDITFEYREIHRRVS